MDSRSFTMDDYSHPELNQPCEFFGGSYHFIKEGKLNYHGREVLYFLGVAGVESSCCGTGGCAFIKIPGFIRSWKTKQDESGQPVSEIEKIVEEEVQRDIREIFEKKYPAFRQIEFL